MYSNNSAAEATSINSAIFLTKRFWNAKSDQKFGRREMVLAIPMPRGKRTGSGMPFWIASF
jgi:hypothetical protein